MILGREGYRAEGLPMHTTRTRPLARLATTLVAMTAMIAGALLVAPPANAVPVQLINDEHGFTYIANNANVAAGASLVAYDKVKGGSTPTIPDTVEIGGIDYDVTSIGTSAFYSTGLTSVTIGANVTAIGDAAFGQNPLTAIPLPSGLTTIGPQAFAGNNLTSLTLPASVTSIGSDAFAGNDIASVNFPSGLTAIGDRVFYGNDFATITIPGTVKTIGTQAFGNNSMSSATLLNGVTTIGEGAFVQNALTSVTIPSSVTTIAKEAFWLNELASVTIPQGVQTIGQGAFQQNELTSVTIPNSVTIVDNAAFQYNNLTSVTIGSGVTLVGDEAFEGNTGLTAVKFLGAPPAVGDAGVDESFDSANPALVLHYLSTNLGWTTPTWSGYTTMKELKASITGTAREKYKLTAVPNQTPPASINLAYQWYADGVAISGANTNTITLAKAQAARRVTVKITATSTGGGAYSEVATSPSTVVVSSLYKRIVRSAYTIPHGKGLTVTATGFGNRRYVRILMNNVVRYTGRSDSLGTVRKYVTFKSGTKAGGRSVKVQYKSSNGKWYTGISTTVNYK